MATVKDTLISAIAGYETMTAEQKIAALEAASIPGVDMTKYVAKETFDNKMTELGEKTKRIRELEKAQLSEEDRLKQDRAAFEEEKRKFTKERNATLCKGILAQGGFQPTDYAGFDLDNFEDEAKAKSFADNLVKLAQAQRAAADTAARNNLLGGQQPPKGGATPDQAAKLKADYQKAAAAGDSFTMTMLIMEAQQKGVSLN